MTLEPIGDIFALVSPVTIMASIVVGIAAGYVLARTQTPPIAVRDALLVVMPWMLTMGASRIVDGSPTWDRWIGFAAVFTVYAVGLGCGVWLRLRAKEGRP